MSHFKQSFAWWSFGQGVSDPRQFLQAAKAIGYQGVELLPFELWEAARQAGLIIASENGASLTHGMNHREHHRQIEDDVRKKLELAVQYGIPNLIVFSGNRMGISDESGLENTIECLRRLAPAAEAHGVTLVLELLNSKVDHPDYQCDHTAWALAAVKAVNSPRVQILYDIYHMQIMEGDIIRTIQQAIGYIGHVHTAGNPGRRDLDQEQEINYPAIMRTLNNLGYTGFVGQEFIPKGDPLKALQDAYHLCNVD